MSQQFFVVKKHEFDAQHIREYPRALARSQEDTLRLVAKQYIPRSNPNPQPRDVTIIGAHANGFPKELFEPFWDDLLAVSERHGLRIRSIWVADAAWQGESGLLNQDLLGNDPSWYDHARDVIQMINTFRREMPRPLVGVGHSFGGTVVTQAALWHPRLFSSLVLLDPVMSSRPAGSTQEFLPLELSAVRREIWPSLAAAEKSYRRSPFYQSWDPRVLDAWLKHGLTPVPTKWFPAGTNSQEGQEDGPPVTLTTTKHQEVFTFMRPLLQGVDAQGKRVYNRQRVRDVSDASLESVFGLSGPDASSSPAGKLYRPEVPNTFMQLPHLRPGVLYIFGGISPMSPPDMRQEKMDTTGTGIGGSGGLKEGRVREAVLENVGHLVPMERPGECAELAASFLGHDLVHEREEAAELAAAWWPRSDAQKQTIDAEWQTLIRKKPKSKL